MTLQSIINTSSRATVSSAETHRVAAIHNIEHAISSEDLEPLQIARLERLMKSLRSAENDSPERKLDLITNTLIPALLAMGLAATAE